MGIASVDELGHAIDADWSRLNYDPYQLPELATRHLAAARLHRALRPVDILAWALRGDLPDQFDKLSTFGQPPITLFRARHFVIDALFWLDGTTTIHDHAFSGAFQVLSGSSIETTFRFEASRDGGGHFFFGSLGLLDSALRTTGDARPITPESSYIHALFHLERPSVTILIRTLQLPRIAAQLQYEPCGFAWSPFFRDPTLDRMVEVVELLDRSNDQAFEDLAGGLMTRSDLYTTFRLLRACVEMKDERRLSALLERLADRDAADTFSGWLAKERVERFLMRQRAFVHEPDLRFLLAVLLNSHRGDHSLRLVSAFAGPDKDPAAETASWLARLSRITLRLQVGGEPWAPNVLGLPDFEEGHEKVLADALAGRARTFTTSERAFLDRLHALPHLEALFGT
jgi:hypothetical protein